MTVLCDYCAQPARLVMGDAIYPGRPDLHAKSFWQCQPCAAYVGCHPGTQNPLGRLANAELRKAKMAAHTALDPIWRSGSMKRKDAYGWLAQQLGIKRNDCHIGMFDVDQCKRVVAACEQRKEPA
jgi:hypothetical protein